MEVKSPHEGNYKYSEEWRHLCEVRELERMYFYDKANYFEHMKLIAQKRNPTIAYDLDKQVRGA